MTTDEIIESYLGGRVSRERAIELLVAEGVSRAVAEYNLESLDTIDVVLCKDPDEDAEDRH
ncbi:hypothetical protein [Sulfuriroseicoccus oceanibius]|uniref:Uncharacterized protein n=1 Tax=Sulfuriroseicoccus oceanibius TaxID=2707525 RepID=A0A6B3L7L1_9BACT|nr:hypothetical protein [Sulfuriroseicoccus oceanibius]QQL43720.1 hypothetical protein G3M56_007350 [Sulfuriroseicoccus oceanibius]